jgi:large subunit ribosomal protein L32
VVTLNNPSKERIKNIMANPKQRHTRHRRDRARKQYDVALTNMQACPKCQTPVLPHRVCSQCGTYKGKEVVNVMPRIKQEKKAA